MCWCQAPHKHSLNWSIIHQYSFKFFQILSIFSQIPTTTVFSNVPTLLYSFKNACQILLKRLEPIIKKNPEGAWEEWVSSALSVTADEKVVRTAAESAVERVVEPRGLSARSRWLWETAGFPGRIPGRIPRQGSQAGFPGLLCEISQVWSKSPGNSIAQRRNRSVWRTTRDLPSLPK